MIEIVAVLITAGNSQDTGAQDVGKPMCDAMAIARIGDQSGQLVGNAKAPLGGGEKHHAAVRRQPPTIKRSNDFLASNGWEIEPQEAIVRHGGYSSHDSVNCLVSTPNSVNDVIALCDIRQRIPAMSVHKMG